MSVHSKVYTVRMEMNATAFRKSLFRTLDRALEGEPLFVTYKGARVHIVPTKKTSKLARLVKHDTIVGDDESIMGPHAEVMRLWEEKWKKRGKLD